MKRFLALLCLVLLAQPVLAQKAEMASGSENVWNFRFSPLGALIGLINAELDYKIGPQMTVGPSLQYWNLTISDINVKLTGIGVQGRYFFDQVYSDSWYAVGEVGYASAEASIRSGGVTYTGKASGAGLRLGGGYHWFWDSFNLNLGAMIGLSPGSKVELKDSNGNKYQDSYSGSAGGGIEFTIGWMF